MWQKPEEEFSDDGEEDGELRTKMLCNSVWLNMTQTNFYTTWF